MATSYPVSKRSTVGELLASSFFLYLTNFALFALTAAVFRLPLIVISRFLTGALPTDPLGEFAAQQLLGVFWLLTGDAIVTLALTVQCIEALQGRSVTVAEGIRRGLRRYGPYLIIQGALTVARVLATIAPLMLMPEIWNIVEGGREFSDLDSDLDLEGLLPCALVSLTLHVPLFYLSLRWQVFQVALVAEGTGALDSLRRSWRLSRESVLRIFGIFLLLAIFSWLVTVLPATLLRWVVDVLLPPLHPGLGEEVFTTVSTLSPAVSQPFSVAVGVLLFYNLRMREDAYAPGAGASGSA